MENAMDRLQLGMDLEALSNQGRNYSAPTSDETLPSGTQAEVCLIKPNALVGAEAEDRKDHFINRDGRRYAGTHLIIDLWGASRIDELPHVQETLIKAAKDAGATVLSIDLHHFTPNNGISGVVVLAESHISIHTWPEENYAALDVFMCGDAKPERAIDVFKAAFKPAKTLVDTLRRGETPLKQVPAKTVLAAKGKGKGKIKSAA